MDKPEEEKAERAGEATGKDENAEEEEGECPFCLFMKSGPCGKEFQEWEDCVQEAEKVAEETVVRCRSITQMLMKCMEGESYYSVVLQAGEKLSDSGGDVDRADEQQPQQPQQQEQQKQEEEQQQEVVEQTSSRPEQEQQEQGRLQVHVQVDDRQGMAA